MDTFIRYTVNACGSHSALPRPAGTVFAYGQTGTGKSHTMEGKDEPADLRGIIPNTFNYVFDTIGRMSEQQPPIACYYHSLLFSGACIALAGWKSTRCDRLAAPGTLHTSLEISSPPRPLHNAAGGAKQFLVRASYLEIYNEDIRDLLSKNPDAKLELKETPDRGVYVKDLMQFVVKSKEEIANVLQARRGLCAA